MRCPAGEPVRRQLSNWNAPVLQIIRKLEGKAHSELNLARGERRRESQGLVGIKIRVAVNIKGCGKIRTDHVVHTGVVGVVGQVETFRGKHKRRLLAKFERAAQAQIEIGKARAESSVAASAGRAIVGEVSVAVDVRARQKIEGMTA